MFGSTADIARLWRRERLFKPAMSARARDDLYAGWQDAVRRVRMQENVLLGIMTVLVVGLVVWLRGLWR